MTFRRSQPCRHFSFFAALLLVVTALWGCANVRSASETTPAGITVVVAPTSATVQVATNKQFSATVSNTSNTAVAWQVNGVAGGDSTHGTISGTGMYSAPTTVPAPATVTVTAVSQAQSTKSASAQVTIGATAGAVAVTLNISTVSVQTTQSTSVTATVANDPQNKGVTWALAGTGCTGAACGLLSSTSSASGTAITYTAPASVPTPSVVTVTAVSVADTSKTASATITVTSTGTGSVAVSVSPKRVGA